MSGLKCSRDLPKLTPNMKTDHRFTALKPERRGGPDLLVKMTSYFLKSDIIEVGWQRYCSAVYKYAIQCVIHSPSWLQGIETTKWLNHMSSLMKAVVTVVNAVDKEWRPVLVHCSDGWDRTPQIVALAEILLDPYYRTFEVRIIEVCLYIFDAVLENAIFSPLYGWYWKNNKKISVNWITCLIKLFFFYWVKMCFVNFKVSGYAISYLPLWLLCMDKHNGKKLYWIIHWISCGARLWKTCLDFQSWLSERIFLNMCSATLK